MSEVTRVNDARTSDKGKLTEIKQVMVTEFKMQEILKGDVILQPTRAV